ncbi:receptor-type tyrosine-protein phosphatase V-like [Trichosurus vulpecula]|uniref:receptor-type tyrosine-protein phosphatase V-like n=1 Tax=Trichosurus vulpecula TaxID=9337 RepID=UPI00186ACC09|nr:receptor-type tyrosine-protein phosphatase V-like [Trichosurus vulpecula]
MRPLLFFTVLLWLRGTLEEDDDGCNQVEVPAESELGEQPLQVNVSNKGQPASLVLNWGTPIPAGLGYVLHLTQLGLSAPLERLRLQAGPNASSFQFQDLVPGSHYQLEVTVLLPCSQNSTVTLTVQTTPSPVLNLRLNNSGSPSRLEANWESAPGEQDGYQLCLYHLESQTLAWNISVAPGILSYHFDSLLPGSEYALWITTWAGALHAKTSIRQWTAPIPPEHLVLFAMGTNALQASWNRAEGAAWFHLTLLDLLDGTILTAVAKRGNTSHTFYHLSPGTPYQLSLNAIAGLLQIGGPNATSQTYPSVPFDLMLTPWPPGLLASWRAGPGHRDGYLLQLTGQAERNSTLGPEALNTTFPGPLPAGHYTLELTALAGPHGASAQAHTWLESFPDSKTRPQPGVLQLAGLQASREPGRRVLLYPEGSPDVIANVSVLPNATHVTFRGLVPGAQYRVDIILPSGATTQRLVGHTWPRAPQSLQVTGRGSSTNLDVRWVSPEGRRDGYGVSWQEEGTQKTLGFLGVGSKQTNLTLEGLTPGSCFIVSAWAWAGRLNSTTQKAQTCTFPASPVNLSLGSEGNPSTLTAHWSPPPGALDGYRLRLLHLAPLKLKEEAVLSSEIQSFSWTQLPPGMEFMVQLVALRGVDESDIINATAWTYPEAPANLTLFNVGSPEASALLASWKPSGAQSFELTLYQLPMGNATHHVILMGNVTSYAFWGLEPGTAYSLRAGSIGGPYQAWAPNITSWTFPLTPAMVNVTNRDPTRVCVSWDHASGSQDGYRVTLHQEGSTVSTTAVGPEVNNISFSNLTPGTEYWVEIVSLAGPHHSAAANITSWTPPLVPKELSVTMQGDNAMVALTWAAAPKGQGKCQAQLLESGQLLRRQPVSLGQTRLILRGLIPGHTFFFSVLCQAGPLQASTSPIALLVEPRPVEDVQCQPEATHLALNWTVPVGEVGTCLVMAEQLETGGKAQPIFSANTSRNSLWLPGLTPATSYRLSLTLLGRNGLWSQTVTLLCTTSPEAWRPPEMAAAPHLESEAGAGVVITRDMFGEDNGQIQWYGVIATTNASLVQPSREAISHTWYDHYYRGLDSYLAVLLPSPFRPGPWAMPRSWTVPVGTEDCGQTQQTCNGKLKPDAQYRFSVAAFTSSDPVNPTVSFTAFSEPRASVSGSSMPLLVASGIVSGCLFTLCAVLGLLCCRRVRVERLEKNHFSQEMTPYKEMNIRRPILSRNFQQNYEAKKANAHQAFFQEFEELKEVGKELSKLEAENPANAIKNRYPHVLPYDHSRVRLTYVDGEPHSDYINANFIPGYTRSKEFIATQGPLRKTIEDFWRLVWEQQIHTIVMLTVGMENGRVLCEHYWPLDSTPVTHGQITICLLGEEKGEDWTRRELQVQYGPQQEERRVQQLHFTAWPDHGVPEAPGSLVKFAELVQEEIKAAPSTVPTLVHCSAGVGRTGTFVALIRLLRQLQEEQMVDVFYTVYALRQNRPLMIQTLAQYIFLHSCLLDKIMEEPAESLVSWPIIVRNFAQKHAKRSAHTNAGFLREYELLLQAIKDQDNSAQHQLGSATSQLLSYDRWKMKFSLEENPANSVQAWFFPGGLSVRDQVALAGPAETEEFWQLVWEHGVRVLVSLCPLGTQNEKWWPVLEYPIHIEALTVRWVEQKDVAGWLCLHLRVKHEKKEKELKVKLFQFPCWESGQEPPAQVLLSFLAAVGQHHSRIKKKKPKTVLMYSSSGIPQLGVLLAMDRLLQQAKFQSSVDIFGVVLQLARACGSMTPTLEQYIYLYDCVGSALANGLA